MYLHANAKLGLAGRSALVTAIEGGLSLRAAAAAFSVSPATAHRWWHRWLEGERRPQSLLDRSSRPRRSPRLLPAELQERICDCRRKTGWGPRLVAGATGFAHSTEWAYGLVYRSLRQRNGALPHWLDYYNRLRPHSSLGGRPPISRVHNVRG
jgi:transposase